MFTFITSCSRPVAYFQPSIREHIVTNVEQTKPLDVNQTPTDQPIIELNMPQQLVQATSKADTVDALVRANSQLTTTQAKTVQKRLNRVQTCLGLEATKASQAPTKIATPRKMNLLERMMLKKLNRQISKQLAPANPDRTLASTSILILGAVLVLGGILLLALTSGGGFALGAIALAAGLVILLIELL
ncbi:hypothetical protein GO730_12175 [Spirosoma sp. HMF3257]|uniref:Uncharacterized protein n=2 Tax=Spirosoma telluris TaxID=2183553 RepID=A0A327NV13_9BACT|nr:hypothetical protein [Spirosoma telluris]RAI78433.1 hypothetical protein HMF3257_12090 [Spirosoma telluris]